MEIAFHHNTVTILTANQTRRAAAAFDFPLDLAVSNFPIWLRSIICRVVYTTPETLCQLGSGARRETAAQYQLDCVVALSSLGGMHLLGTIDEAFPIQKTT